MLRIQTPSRLLLLITAAVPSLVACDDPPKGAPSVATSAAQGQSAALPTATPTPTPAAKPSATVAMPERPVPRESPTVTSSMKPEVQMKAIAYMAAMRAPQDGDPMPDAAFGETLQKTLDPIAKSFGASTGAKTGAEIAAGGRELSLLLAKGCDAEASQRMVSQRAGMSLETLRSNGVLVIRCNDSRVQCLQSTRDKTDVLCTTAPRKK
jgi:hypothetical protein